MTGATTFHEVEVTSRDSATTFKTYIASPELVIVDGPGVRTSSQTLQAASVRFAHKSGQTADISICPLCARSDRVRRTKVRFPRVLIAGCRAWSAWPEPEVWLLRGEASNETAAHLGRGSQLDLRAAHPNVTERAVIERMKLAYRRDVGALDGIGAPPFAGRG